MLLCLKYNDAKLFIFLSNHCIVQFYKIRIKIKVTIKIKVKIQM